MYVSVCMCVCMYDVNNIKHVEVCLWIFLTLKDGRVVGLALGEDVGVRVDRVLGFAVGY